MIQSIAVFCGSNTGTDPAFLEAAIALGESLASRKIKLVYGGGKVGLMGKIAESVLANGGEVIGVIPEFMIEKELAHPGLTELIVTPSMHERKAVMAEKSDAFIAMAGGIGTLEEVIEVFTWLQLHIHVKPVSVLNTNGYYNHLLAFMDHMVSSGLLKDIHRNRMLQDRSIDGLLEKIIDCKYTFEPSWYIAEKSNFEKT